VRRRQKGRERQKGEEDTKREEKTEWGKQRQRGRRRQNLYSPTLCSVLYSTLYSMYYRMISFTGCCSSLRAGTGKKRRTPSRLKNR
jgi:hypothetical protein